jgi:hypothetical protein
MFEPIEAEGLETVGCAARGIDLEIRIPTDCSDEPCRLIKPKIFEVPD